MRQREFLAVQEESRSVHPDMSPATQSQNALVDSALVLDARLIDIFKAIEEANIRYCLLRGYELLWHQGNKEIDLLVSHEQLQELANLLRSRGFAELPSWGHAPHHFFVSYNRTNDTWLKLDIVDAVRYGDPIRALEIDITNNLLHNRRRCMYTYLPASEDEFFKLLLHCVLHMRAFTPEKSARLIELWREITERPIAAIQFAEHVSTHLSPAVTNAMLERMAATGDCEPLLKQRSRIIHRLFWAAPAGNTWRWLSTKCLRILRPVLFPIFRRGLLIALLAPDGAGKTTLAHTLAKEPFISAKVIYMGANSKAQSITLRPAAWLRTRYPSLFGENLSPGRPFAIRALNYLISVLEHWYRLGLGIYHKLRGRFVIFDRYMYDSWLGTQNSQRKPRRERLFDLVWPKADMIIVLDAPGRVLYERKREHSPEWLEGRRREYLQLEKRLPDAIYVNADRPEAEICRDVISLIWERYAAREKWNWRR
jgi:thymidylate kinase